MEKIKMLIVLFVMSGAMGKIQAQQVSVSAGADIVSSYIWRGLYCGPASVQPDISLKAGNIMVGIWGSASFDSRWREFDLYARYSLGNVSLTMTDYFFPRDLPTGEGSSYFDFSEHVIEATLGYSIGDVPLSLAWNTNLVGDENNSTYIEADYSLPLSMVTLDFVLGATPWKGAYSDSFALVNLAIKASKQIHVTPSFSLPVFTQAVLNPDSKDVFLVFGVSF